MCCALVYCLVVDLTISVLVSVGLLFYDVELDVVKRYPEPHGQVTAYNRSPVH